MALQDDRMHTPSGPVPTGFIATVVTSSVLTGVNQVIAVTNNSRKAFLISNPSLANFVDVAFGTAAVVGQHLRLGCLGVGANAGRHWFSSGELGIIHVGSVQVIGTAGQRINFTEWSY